MLISGRKGRSQSGGGEVSEFMKTGESKSEEWTNGHAYGRKKTRQLNPNSSMLARYPVDVDVDVAVLD